MYMGVILGSDTAATAVISAPHVYGGDPATYRRTYQTTLVLPMYMGVILYLRSTSGGWNCAPHVYGGDPEGRFRSVDRTVCSPCIWG